MCFVHTEKCLTNLVENKEEYCYSVRWYSVLGTYYLSMLISDLCIHFVL
jgi:hypothetical protein